MTKKSLTPELDALQRYLLNTTEGKMVKDRLGGFVLLGDIQRIGIIEKSILRVVIENYCVKAHKEAWSLDKLEIELKKELLGEDA